MEYLDNYDCFVVIGGENNKYVELFDIFTQKWSKLPELNIPRANINIFFDDYTSELYALFGALGDYSEKKNVYSEAIEVLELNDISSGWCKIDYYKGSSFDIRQENVTTLPFTRTKLLIYGGKSSRDNENLFGIYLIDKMGLIKADKDVIEKIKFEQKKIKMINKTYEKMSNLFKNWANSLKKQNTLVFVGRYNFIFEKSLIFLFFLLFRIPLYNSLSLELSSLFFEESNLVQRFIGLIKGLMLRFMDI